MPIASFRRTRTDNIDLTQVQDAVSFVFQDIASKAILDGRMISDVLVNGAKMVNHGLARKLQGYIVIAKDSNESIWDSQTTNTTPSISLILNSSGPVRVNLWVF